MPILREKNAPIAKKCSLASWKKGVDYINHSRTVRNRKRTALTEIILDIDDDQGAAYIHGERAINMIRERCHWKHIMLAFPLARYERCETITVRKVGVIVLGELEIVLSENTSF